MSLPFRLAGQLILKAFDVAIAVSEWNDRRKAAKSGTVLTYKDVQHIQSQISEATARRSAKTVVIPRPKP